MDGEKGYIKTSLISIMNSELKTQRNIAQKEKAQGPTRYLIFRPSARFQSCKGIDTESD